MGSENENIGGVAVQIVGNYAPLLKDLETAAQIATSAGGEIAAGLNKGAAAASEFETKLHALYASGNTVAEALEKVQAGSAAMASGVGQAGAAAATAAVQLALFDQAAMVPYADAAGQLNLFSDELEPIANAAKQAAAGVEQFAAAEKHVGDEAVQSVSRLDQFKTAIGDFSSKLQQGAGGLVTIGGMLTAAVTVPLVGVAAAALKVSGEIEQARVAFTTLLGSADAAKAHLEDLKKFAASTPFEFPDLVVASKRLQALGFEAKSIIPTLTAVGNAASALGSGSEGISRITTALGQMQMAARVTAQDMRQLTEAGIPAWKILAETLKTDVAGAMALVEKRAVDSATAVPALLAGMNAKFHGLMDEQAKTLLGSWSNFKDKLTFTLMDIGDTIAPVAKRIVNDYLNPILDWAKGATAAFAGLPPAIQGVVIGLAGLAAGVGPLLVALGGIGFAITQISGAIPILAAIAGGLASVVGVVLVAAIAGAVLAFADLQAAMSGVHAKQDEIARKFDLYIAKLVDGAKTADQMAAAEEKVKLALDAGALSKDQATKLLTQLAEAQKKVVGLEWSKYAQEMGLAIHIVTTGMSGAMTTTEAFGVKLKALREEVTNTRAALDQATAKYNDHKATAADVAKAYDTWQSATSALKGAQQALLPVVTNVHRATKDFVDVAGRSFPDAATAAANATDAFAIKLGQQNEQIAQAQKYLDYALDRYRKYRDNAGEVVKALDALTAAQAKVTQELGKLPDASEEFKKWEKAAAETARHLLTLLPPLGAIPPLVRTLAIDLYDLGLRARDAAGEITTKLLAAFEDLATKQTPTLEEAHLAWSKVSADVNRLAKYDLPEALKVYGEYETLLNRLGASQGEILGVRKEYLGVEIRIAEQTGASATSQIIGLQNVKLAQGLLYDQTHLLGDLYVDVTNDILKGFDLMGKSMADAIFDSKNLGDAFIKTGKQIGKTILEDIIGTYFKALKDEILKSTGLLDGMARTMAKIFGGKPADAAANTAADAAAKVGGAAKTGAAAGGAGGAIDTATAIGQLISSIVGNLQMAKMETSLNAIEHNTRFMEIIVQKFAEQDEWQRHREVLEVLGNIFARLGEVGVGVIQTVADSGAQVVDSIRESSGGSALHGGRPRPEPSPFEFHTGNLIADGIMNSLLHGNSGIPQMAGGGPIIGDGLRYLHDGEWVVPRAAVPQMAAMSSPASARTASVSIGAGTNTFNIYESANPRETARQVAEMLKILSPRYSAYST